MHAWILCLLLLFPFPAQAVLPPDILFSVTSTLTQSIVAISIVLSGMWLSLTTFVRENSWKFWLIQLLIGCVLIGSIVYVFSGEKAPEQTRVTVPQIPEGVLPELSSLRIVLVGKNTAEPVVLELDLNVRTVAEEYEYFHYGALVVGNRAYNAYVDGPINALAITPVGYISRIDITRAPDLSARYSISLAVDIGGQQVEADIQNLSGDFLEKNTPLYFKEASFGSANVVINGAPIEAYAFVSPVYSRDYREYVYFDGFDVVRGQAKQFIVFDSEGGSYVVDKTDIENPVPAYTSHQWVLMKKADGGSYKGFSAGVNSDADGENATLWNVTSFDVPFELNLTSGQKYSGGLHGRTIQGTVTREGRVLPVIGVAHIESL